MFKEGWSVRGRRPGRCVACPDAPETTEEIDKCRQANVAVYASRVSAGMPLFEPLPRPERFEGRRRKPEA